MLLGENEVRSFKLRKLIPIFINELMSHKRRLYPLKLFISNFAAGTKKKENARPQAQTQRSAHSSFLRRLLNVLRLLNKARGSRV